MSLVAECCGRAVGLLCLTADVDIEPAARSVPGGSHGPAGHCSQTRSQPELQAAHGGLLRSVG